jgi:hypothetical protein
MPIGGTSSGEFVDPAAPGTRLDYWLAEVGSSAVHGPVHIPAVVRSPSRPLGLRVVPNPTARGARVSFRVDAAGSTARVRILGASGRELRVLLLERAIEGENTVSWDGADARGLTAAPGTYFITV